MFRVFWAATLTVVLLMVAHTAQASIQVTVKNFNSTTLLMSATGGINTTGLQGIVGDENFYAPSIKPSRGSFATGWLNPPGNGGAKSTAYKFTAGSPTEFIGGDSSIAPAGSYATKSFGVIKGTLSPGMFFIVPEGYQSGSSLKANVYMQNCTIETMGLQRGHSYTWTLQNSETVTLHISTLREEQVPEPTAALIWSMLAGLGLTFRRRR